ncbi:hypothetical protein [Streptomyces sp. NPDC008122]|uniref:hypothetical protein n=1 Tax=Streptomyces sp. NPDC008122 TaxID=3364810 RepID=UPI0036EFAF12
MSIFESLGVPLLTVAVTLGGGWLVTTRVTDHWDRIKKDRDMDLTAAGEFQRLYGEFVAVWKTWNALTSGHTPVTSPEHPGWACLERATAAEGAIEALLAKLAAERVLTREEVDVLGGVRQAFKAVRRAIQQGEPLDWWSSEIQPYVAFKSLASAVSVLLGTAPRSRRRPTAAVAARTFREITHNRHEVQWIEAADGISLGVRSS